MALTDFLRAPSKKSLLAMLKKADKLTPRLLDKLFEGILFKSEFKGYVENGGIDEDYSDYVRKDGTRALTANWDAGSFEIRARTLESDVATGTAPLTIASTTLVTNLNADKLDSQEGTYYLNSDNFTGTEWTDLTDAGATTLHKHDHGGQDGLADDDHTQYFLTNGTRNITGGFTVEGTESEVTFEGDDIFFDGTITATSGINTDEISDNGAGYLSLPNTVVQGYLDVDFGISTSIITVSVAVAYDVTESESTILCDATSNNVTINLPSTGDVREGIIFTIKAINTDNTVTVSPDGSEEIDGSNADIILSLMESITIQSDGSNWWII